MISDEALIVVVYDALSVVMDASRSQKDRELTLNWIWTLLKQLPIEAIKKSLNPS